MSKEVYYKNNPELLQSPEYSFFYYSSKDIEKEENDTLLTELYNMFSGTYYWRVDECWFVSRTESYANVSLFIPKKFNFEVEKILRDRIDHLNWTIVKTSDTIPKDQTINKFHQETVYLSTDETKDPLTSGVYSLNSSDGDVIEFSYLVEPHSWGDDSFIYTKEKETFPYDKEKVNLVTTYIETVILWMRKQL